MFYVLCVVKTFEVAVVRVKATSLIHAIQTQAAVINIQFYATVICAEQFIL